MCLLVSQCAPLFKELTQDYGAFYCAKPVAKFHLIQEHIKGNRVLAEMQTNYAK